MYSIQAKSFLNDFWNLYVKLIVVIISKKMFEVFSLDEEHLAYSIQSELGEIDYHDNHTDLDERLINILNESESILEISTDFEF